MHINKPARSAQFTPGPWQVNDSTENDDDTTLTIFAPADEVEIATMSAYENGCECFSEIRENAHLIAAAPALYEAVQNLLEFIKGNRGAREGNPYCKAEVRQALKVLAAIQGKKDYLDADTLPQAEGA